MKFEGFVQINTTIGTFVCKAAEDQGDYIKIDGPVCLTMQIHEDKKTGQIQRLWNKDRVKERFLLKRIVVGVDVLDPADLDKSSKEIYSSLSGVELV